MDAYCLRNLYRAYLRLLDPGMDLPLPSLSVRPGIDAGWHAALELGKDSVRGEGADPQSALLDLENCVARRMILRLDVLSRKPRDDSDDR